MTKKKVDKAEAEKSEHEAGAETKPVGDHLECCLVPYPTEYQEAAGVLLAYVTGQQPPLNEVAHACYHLQGVALGVLLPHHEGEHTDYQTSPRKLTDNVPAEQGKEGQPLDEDDQFDRPDGFKNKPPLVGKKNHAGLKGCTPPDQVNREECVHVLKQAAGQHDQGVGAAREVGGLLPAGFGKKLLSVVLSILMELMAGTAA